MELLPSAQTASRKENFVSANKSPLKNRNWTFQFRKVRYFTWKPELHCVKSVCVRSYSGPHFPPFGLKTERYGVSLRIQSECGKMRTRITPNTETFYAILVSNILWMIVAWSSVLPVLVRKPIFVYFGNEVWLFMYFFFWKK